MSESIEAFHWLLRSKDAAFRQIEAVLGPKPPDCGCTGCAFEMGEALRLEREALALTLDDYEDD